MLVPFGSTTNFDVVYESALADQGVNVAALCQSILDHCEFDKLRLQVLFGSIPINTPPGTIHVQLVPGPGGADEQGSYITLYCDATTDPSTLPALMVAEEAEIFMQYQQKGWIFNWSTGEALSRVCGPILYPAATNFGTGASWLNSVLTGYAAANCAPCPPTQLPPDWIDYVCQTDQDSVSIGCGTLFLNYLAYQLNFAWPEIISAGTGTSRTLANTGQILGMIDVWGDFVKIVNTYLINSLPSETPVIGKPSQQSDNPYPVGNISVSNGPDLYLRHNLTDDGTTHTGSLSDSPDIIVTGTQSGDPQTQYSTAASIASDLQSDPAIIAGQNYYIYTRAWNRGTNAVNAFTHVYWAQPSTLVTPNTWNYIGSAYYPNVPPAQAATISDPGILWPASQLPGAGHYCFVAVVGNAWDPPPNPADFATFDDFVNYIYANNNITWRNFNVVESGQQSTGTLGQLLPLPFHITGAWDQARPFDFETIALLPAGSQLSLELPHWLGRRLMPDHPPAQQALHLESPTLEPIEMPPVRLPLNPSGVHPLTAVDLPAASAAASNFYVSVPSGVHLVPYNIAIRQIYQGREVGRITWVLMPPPLILR
jgi:hypothetical protein